MKTVILADLIGSGKKEGSIPGGALINNNDGGVQQGGVRVEPAKLLECGSLLSRFFHR